MSNIHIQIGGVTLPIKKLIDQELEMQFEYRQKLEAMEMKRKFNYAYSELRRLIAESGDRLKNYYSIIDHHNQVISVRKTLFQHL